MYPKMVTALCITVCMFFFGCSARMGVVQPLDPRSPLNVLGSYTSTPNNNSLIIINVVGKGVAPTDAVNRGQAILLAERAATADGYRKLIERIKGLYVDAYSHYGNGQADYERIRLETASWLRGAEIVDASQTEFGITEVHMRVYLLLAQNHILYHYNDHTFLSNYLY